MSRARRARATLDLVRAERRVEAAAAEALQTLGEVALSALRAADMQPYVLDARLPDWQAAVDDVLLPAIAAVHAGAFAGEARTPVTAAATPAEVAGIPEHEGARSLADRRASEHLASVRNRLVGVSDGVFDSIRRELETGRNAATTWTDPTTGEVFTDVGESIPQLAERVEGLLSSGQTWKGRARTIARTEVIGAANAGALSAAGYNADVLGADSAQVVKQWLATPGPRTRDTHLAADGQQVFGLQTPFDVGGAEMQAPGDPMGPAEEVINCRCTVTFIYPGDPDYPGDAPAAAEVTALDAPDAAPPLLSPGQYDVMAPQSTWSAEQQTAIREALHATPEGKALHEVLDRFQDGGSIARLRSSIEKALEGQSLPLATERKVNALLGAIRDAPTEWAPDTLYRGMTVKGSAETVMARYVPGESLDLSLTSFSSDRKVGQRFQQMTATGKGKETRVMVELVGDGKKALPIQNLARDRRLFREKEWVTAGRYKVLEVKKSPSGGLILRVQQEATL